MRYKFSKKLLHSDSKQVIAGGIASLILISFIWVFETLIQAQSKKIQSDVRLEAFSYGSLLRSRVDRELNSLLYLSGGLASYLTVYHQVLEPKKVNAILADLYARSKHVRNLGIAVGYQVTYVYPVKGNEKVIGMDYRDLPKQWLQVKRAVDTKTGVLAGPLTLVQGGRALVYRYPVFVENQYWGILSTVINTEPFLNAAFKGVSNNDYEFAVRVKDYSGDLEETFFGDAKLFANPKSFLMESEVPNGKWEWAILRKTVSSSAYFISLMRLMELVSSVLLATAIYLFLRERSKLSRDALYDSLTGLANRRLLYDRIYQELAQADRSNKFIAIMFVDLDHFKKINDNYGHDFGDQLLKTVAKKLTHCVRAIDTVGRLGGDEFVVVLSRINQPKDAALVAESIMKAFDNPVLIFDSNINISLSMGVAVYAPKSDESINGLMKKADMALYAAKGAGRGGYKISN